MEPKVPDASEMPDSSDRTFAAGDGVRRGELREQVRERVENRPGVYRLLGADGEVLYVGKSVRVRTRLLSYFRADPCEKAGRIVASAERVEWDYVPNEFAALLLELKQIKRWRPRYNREHKRDRGHCFVKITSEAAPRLLVVGRVVLDGADYYGPFRGRGRIKGALREIADLLELRDCAAKTPIRFADQREIFGRSDPPLCLRAELGRCLAPCVGGCTRSEYVERVDLARRFLEGEADEPLSRLRARMREAAERLQYEYAAVLRDRIDRLRAVRDDLVALAHTLEGLTFLYTVPGHAGDDRVYVIRRGAVRAEMPAPSTAAERRRVIERSRELLAGHDPARLRVDPYRIAEMLLVARWFRRNPEERRRAMAAPVLEDRRRTA
ncbi:MAG: UvrB/UvrC motif-containing protein [Gemmatimonadota bacterium]